MAKEKESEVIKISEEDFDTKYQPITNHIARAEQGEDTEDEDVAPWNGTMYETYGEEVAHIVRLANNSKTSKKVWTIIEGDDEDGTQYIVAGYHLVNRMGYIVTKKPWSTGTEEVECDF